MNVDSVLGCCSRTPNERTQKRDVAPHFNETMTEREPRVRRVTKRKANENEEASEDSLDKKDKAAKINNTNKRSRSSHVMPSPAELEDLQRDAMEERSLHAAKNSPPGALTYPPACGATQSEEFTDGDPIQKLNPLFSKTPFRGLVVGPMKSGKTSLLKALINDVFVGIYDEVHVWNPNLCNDPGYEWLWKPNAEGDIFPPDRVHLAWKQVAVDQMIRDVQRERKLEAEQGVPINSQHRALWIIDDSTSMDGSPMANGDRSIVNTRFNGISVINATHRLNLINTLTRGQMEFVIYYPGGNAGDDKLFIEEMGVLDGMTKPSLKQVLSRIAQTKKPFNYVALNNLEPLGRKLRHGIGGPHVLDAY